MTLTSRREDFEAVRRALGDRCPVFGHWGEENFVNEEAANRSWSDPERYNSDPRMIMDDCSVPECRNPEHLRYRPCTHPWHDADVALKRLVMTTTVQVLTAAELEALFHDFQESYPQHVPTDEEALAFRDILEMAYGDDSP